jgi:hypothetical protein
MHSNTTTPQLSLQWNIATTQNNSVYPKSREGHTLTFIPELDQFILFGGISTMRMGDIYLLDDSGHWDQKDCKG